MRIPVLVAFAVALAAALPLALPAAGACHPSFDFGFGDSPRVGIHVDSGGCRHDHVHACAVVETGDPHGGCVRVPPSLGVAWEGLLS